MPTPVLWLSSDRPDRQRGLEVQAGDLGGHRIASHYVRLCFVLHPRRRGWPCPAHGPNSWRRSAGTSSLPWRRGVAAGPHDAPGHVEGLWVCGGEYPLPPVRWTWCFLKLALMGWVPWWSLPRSSLPAALRVRGRAPRLPQPSHGEAELPLFFSLAPCVFLFFVLFFGLVWLFLLSSKNLYIYTSDC